MMEILTPFMLSTEDLTNLCSTEQMILTSSEVSPVRSSVMLSTMDRDLIFLFTLFNSYADEAHMSRLYRSDARLKTSMRYHGLLRFTCHEFGMDSA